MLLSYVSPNKYITQYNYPLVSTISQQTIRSLAKKKNYV